MFQGDHVQDAVVVLSDPRLKGSDLVYHVDILEGKIPATAGLSTLFIDSAVRSWQNEWVGRYSSTDVTIIAPQLQPTAAYRVTDWLSIGAGAGLTLGCLQDKTAVNNLDPNLGDGKPYTPPKVKVVPAKKYTGDLAFFEQLGDTLAMNGAPPADAGILGFFKATGLSVDHGFDPSALSDGEKKSLAQAVKDGESMLAAKSASMGKDVIGWQLSPVLDEYFGTSYLFRAAIGYQAMFVNTPIEAYYPGVFKDTDRKLLDGSTGKYTIKFPKGKTPPAGAFWSVTLYDAKKRLMVENSLNRYKIGSADKLKTGSEGSTTIYIQADSPGKDKESSWLPAPKEPIYMLMRMYEPIITIIFTLHQHI